MHGLLSGWFLHRRFFVDQFYINVSQFWEKQSDAQDVGANRSGATGTAATLSLVNASDGQRYESQGREDVKSSSPPFGAIHDSIQARKFIYSRCTFTTVCLNE